jgi:hypothetical protein
MEPRSPYLVSSAPYFYHGLATHPNLPSGRASASFGAIGHSGGLMVCSTWRDLIKNLGYHRGRFFSNLHVSSPGRCSAPLPLNLSDHSRFQTYLFTLPFAYFLSPSLLSLCVLLVIYACM